MDNWQLQTERMPKSKKVGKKAWYVYPISEASIALLCIYRADFDVGRLNYSQLSQTWFPSNRWFVRIEVLVSMLKRSNPFLCKSVPMADPLSLNDQ